MNKKRGRRARPYVVQLKSGTIHHLSARAYASHIETGMLTEIGDKLARPSEGVTAYIQDGTLLLSRPSDAGYFHFGPKGYAQTSVYRR